jgi:hypothetical protein
LALPPAFLQRERSAGKGGSEDGIFSTLLVATNATIGGNLGLSGNFILGGTTTFNGLEYTWPASQANHRVLHTDGVGGLTDKPRAVITPPRRV